MYKCWSNEGVWGFTYRPQLKTWHTWIEPEFGQKLLCIGARRQDVEQFPRCTARILKSKTTGQQRTDWCTKITCEIYNKSVNIEDKIHSSQIYRRQCTDSYYRLTMSKASNYFQNEDLFDTNADFLFSESLIQMYFNMKTLPLRPLNTEPKPIRICLIPPLSYNSLTKHTVPQKWIIRIDKCVNKRQKNLSLPYEVVLQSNQVHLIRSCLWI